MLYPGDPEEPTPAEAAEALGIAQAVCQALLDRLPSEVRPQALGSASVTWFNGFAPAKLVHVNE